jgi:hypothetical protein
MDSELMMLEISKNGQVGFGDWLGNGFYALLILLRGRI